MLPPLKRGSVLSIWPVGAYNVTQAMQFIRYRPRIVLIDKNQNTHIIKEADDLEYVVEKEIIPDFLKG
jgi:diaminopimelate decarboxylase